ncbi:MAG: succinate dehydrogenase complex, subunit B [Chaenotheca gracillima]|nr:MAG: succinate dehydrogenase complex, subunit B [Chaenotheca gracillima]
MSTFSEIPVLDLSLARDPATKPAFLEELRHTLLEIGFLYIKNTGIDDELIEQVQKQGISFFDLPEEEKLRIEMKNAASFLGYSRLGGEITKNDVDWREQVDISTPHELRKPGAPLYHNLHGPNQWPSSELLPQFRGIIEAYLTSMSAVSTFFTSLVAEALGMPSTAFDKFFDKDQQHKLKIVKYPDISQLNPLNGADGLSVTERQGVGPHKDSMLTSYLLQASHHRGLQVQNAAGTWIDVPPIKGTLVVAIGQGLEALTSGVCTSTTHRVLSPAPGSGPRFSLPFFQGVSYDATFESMDVPADVRALKKSDEIRKGEVEFTFVKGRWNHLGEATLFNRVRSHQDVGEKWYPDLLKEVRETQAQEARDREAKEAKEKAADLGRSQDSGHIGNGVVPSTAVQAH